MYMQISKEGILKSHPLGSAIGQMSAIKSINKAPNSSIRAADGFRTVNLSTEMTAVNPPLAKLMDSAPVCQEAANCLADLNPACQEAARSRNASNPLSQDTARPISKIQASHQAVTSIESNVLQRIIITI